MLFKEKQEILCRGIANTGDGFLLTGSYFKLTHKTRLRFKKVERYFMKNCCIFFFVIPFSAALMAATPVGGLIDQEMWTVTGSPYNVTNDATVNNLTIQPGVGIPSFIAK